MSNIIVPGSPGVEKLENINLAVDASIIELTSFDSNLYRSYIIDGVLFPSVDQTYIYGQWGDASYVLSGYAHYKAYYSNISGLANELGFSQSQLHLGTTVGNSANTEGMRCIFELNNPHNTDAHNAMGSRQFSSHNGAQWLLYGIGQWINTLAPIDIQKFKIYSPNDMKAGSDVTLYGVRK